MHLSAHAEFLSMDRTSSSAHLGVEILQSLVPRTIGRFSISAKRPNLNILHGLPFDVQRLDAVNTITEHNYRPNWVIEEITPGYPVLLRYLMVDARDTGLRINSAQFSNSSDGRSLREVNPLDDPSPWCCKNDSRQKQ